VHTRFLSSTPRALSAWLSCSPHCSLLATGETRETETGKEGRDAIRDGGGGGGDEETETESRVHRPPTFKLNFECNLRY